MDIKKRLDPVSRRILVFSFIYYIASLMMISLMTDSKIYLVFIGLFPLLFYLTFFFIYHAYKKLDHILIWVMPLIFSLLFLFIWSTKVNPTISKMNGPTLTTMNIMLCYLANSLFLMFHTLPAGDKYEKQAEYYKKRSEKSKKEIYQLKAQISEYESRLKITKQNFKLTLRGIEDKCKAINFVIGRVYSNKHGGSPKTREIIRVDKELYNEFSAMASHFKKTQAKKLYNILTGVWIRLNALDHTEKEVFSKGILSDGNSKIINILAEDKDPVKEYHAEAKDVCASLMNYLAENYDIA